MKIWLAIFSDTFDPKTRIEIKIKMKFEYKESVGIVFNLEDRDIPNTSWDELPTIALAIQWWHDTCPKWRATEQSPNI